MTVSDSLAKTETETEKAQIGLVAQPLTTSLKLGSNVFRMTSREFDRAVPVTPAMKPKAENTTPCNSEGERAACVGAAVECAMRVKAF